MSASELTPTPGESPLSADILGDFKAFQQKLENILNVKTVANTSGNFNKFATAAAYDRLMMFLATSLPSAQLIRQPEHDEIMNQYLCLYDIYLIAAWAFVWNLFSDIFSNVIMFSLMA